VAETFDRCPRWGLVPLGAALIAIACSNTQDSRVPVQGDSAAQVQKGAPDPAPPPSSVVAMVDPAVFYVEATESEIDAARQGISGEDFEVIADDMMFYRSSAIERLEAWDIPVSRIAGRRPLQFTVNGTPETTDFSDVTWLDFIVVYRRNERPRAFAPNDIEAVRAYWESGSTATDTAEPVAPPGSF